MKAIKNLDNIAKREGREVTTAEIIRELGFSEFEMRKAYQDVLKDKMKAAKELLKKNNVLERQVRKILRTTMDDGTELPKDVSDYLNKSNAEKFIVWDDEEKMLFRIWQIETYGVKNFKPLEVRRQINEFATIRMEKHWERL
jgi:transcriptional antiterminator Rof (Rho-off)